MLRRIFQRVTSFIQTNKLKMADAMAAETTESSIKRPLDELFDSEAKKLKTEVDVEKRRPKGRKYAMFMMYSGKGYFGMQRNPGARTIESDLNEAMIEAGLIQECQIQNAFKSKRGKLSEEDRKDIIPNIYFQRAARTDKGVSAAGQCCSIMLHTDNEDQITESINKHLVDQIRVIDVQRVTKKFCSKTAASARTYKYMLPTYAFQPCTEIHSEKYKITEDVRKHIAEILGEFVGTHNFHNFTSGKKCDDPSARRFIRTFSIGESFMRNDVEFAVISVKGQSFVLHQIRKMIGLTIAIVRGHCGKDALVKAYSKQKCDVPRAPGLGLMLDRVHYDQYNKKFGTDGIHQPLDFEKYADEIDAFKEAFIYPTIIDTELEEKSMLKWLGSLPLHSFDIIPDEELNYKTNLRLATSKINQTKKMKAEGGEEALTDQNDSDNSKLPVDPESVHDPDAPTTVSNTTNPENSTDNPENVKDNPENVTVNPEKS